MTDVLSVDLGSLTVPRKNILRALSVASSELVYTEKISKRSLPVIRYKHLRVLTTAKAEKECDINEGVASSENLMTCLSRHSNAKMRKVRTEIKEARAQRLREGIVYH